MTAKGEVVEEACRIIQSLTLMTEQGWEDFVENHNQDMRVRMVILNTTVGAMLDAAEFLREYGALD